MRDFSIDLIWTKVQIAITAIGGWIGYFVGGMAEPFAGGELDARNEGESKKSRKEEKQWQKQ